MLKEHISFFRKLEMFVDLCLAAAAFYWWYPFRDIPVLLPCFLGLWLTLLYIEGMYESFRIKRFSDIMLTIWSSALVGIGIAGALAYLLKLEDLSRLSVIYIFLTAAVFTSIEK
ncbi:MAG: hypothetical protein KC618_04605, partial [Candidatus Omnitrophica bacterium]|nr:hypothetical protein [Candidatus Omnitrophota bacterium]